MVKEAVKKVENLCKYSLYILVIVTIQIFMFKGIRDDGGVHLNRIQSLANNIETQGIIGQIQQKIYFSAIDNMGYAFPMFYGDLLLYPFALLYILESHIGFGEYNIIGLCMQVISIASIAQFRYFLSKIYDADAVKFCSLIYVIMPYFQYFIIRQQIGEMIGYLMYPPIFYGFSAILNTPSNERFNRSGYITLTAQMQILILSHIIQAYIVTLALTVWCIFRHREIIKLNRIKTLLASAVTTFGLCSYFILPMLEQLSKKYLVISNTKNDLYSPVQLGIGNLFIPNLLFDIIEALTGHRYYIIQGNGYAPEYFGLLFILIGYIVIKKRSLDSKKFIVMGVGVILICTPVVRLAQILLEKIQFPFRLLEIQSFVLLVFILKSWESITKKDIKRIVSICLISTAIICFESGFIYTECDIKDVDIQLQIGNGCEYLPYSSEYAQSKEVNFNNLYKFRQLLIDVSNTEISNLNTHIIKGGYRVTGISEKYIDTGQVILPITYYYGYSAFDDSGNQYETKLGSYGLLEVTGVENQISEINVIYTGSDVDKYSGILNIVALSIFIIYICTTSLYFKNRIFKRC